MHRNSLSPPVFPCAWAAAWGEDRYGLWQILKLGEVEQVFRWIEPGRFKMGMENSAQRTVTLSGFWLADTAVRQALWLAVMGGDNPSYFQDDLNNPMERVSWLDAQRFIESLNGNVADLFAQLPSEAQWEYACRAGTKTAFSFDDNITPDQVNYDGNYPYAGGKKGLYREKTVAVKALPANPWGLYEMHGNVWEWCQDVWQTDLGTVAEVDPLTEVDGDVGGDRVLRGGSWGSAGGNVCSFIRYHHRSDFHSSIIGFRLALGHTELRSSQVGGAE